MSNNTVKISWFGIILIIVGVVMLLDKFQVINISFSSIFWPLMMLVGIIAVGRGYNQNRRGKIFWGTVLFMYALFFFLRSSDYFEVYSHTFFPATFLIFGIAFFMMYLSNMKDWPLLIPAVVLAAAGSLFILNEYGYIYDWEVWDVIRLYWPVILILFGVAILLRRRYTVNSNKPISGTVPPPNVGS